MVCIPLNVACEARVVFGDCALEPVESADSGWLVSELDCTVTAGPKLREMVETETVTGVEMVFNAMVWVNFLEILYRWRKESQE